MKFTRKGIWLDNGLLYRPLTKFPFINFDFNCVHRTYLEALELDHEYAQGQYTGEKFQPTLKQKILNIILI